MARSRSWICKGCWQHMHVPIAIRGPLAFPFRLCGIRVSQMNPNLCTVCETMFTKVKKKKHLVVPTTVLFADLRGYTALSERIGESRAAVLLDAFYDTCTQAVWDRDGIVNKFIGDAVLAVFNFPIGRADHVRQAVLAGLEIRERCAQEKRLRETTAEGGDLAQVCVGIGIHTGPTSIGEVGTAYRDFTVIGPVVNLASRLQSTAGPGEVLVTEDVYREVRDLAPSAVPLERTFKGIERPLTTWRVSA